ncbi:MAG: multidrug efflux SMR transporter [Phycisphaerales bacterium]|nr:multidrug efflux SMR transporter [Phycisphaerales bacterium]
MSWIQLFLASLFEIAWAVAMKHTDGFTKLWPSMGVIAAMIASFVLLALAIRRIPLGTAYAVWAGIGAAGTACFGIAFLDESASVWRIVSLGAIIAGVLGLRLLHDPGAAGGASITSNGTPHTHPRKGGDA